MAPEMFNEADENTKYTNKIDVYSFGIILIYIVTKNYPKFMIGNVIEGIIPKLPETIVEWVKILISRCLSRSPENRPSFAEIYEVMKLNNYNLFDETKNQKLTVTQKKLKQEIDKTVLKIEAFEYQHQND